MKHLVSTSRTPAWDILIPVKELSTAKSRLSGSLETDTTSDLPGIDNAELALAFTLDVISSAMSCPNVGRLFVVTGDKRVRTLADQFGVEVVSEPKTWDEDPELSALTPLNAAIQFGANRIVSDKGCRSGHTEALSPIAIITGDLPCLNSDSLTEVLELALTHDRSFVPDHTGLGTAMLCIKDPATTAIDPLFGIDSAHAHKASGAATLDNAPPRARLDVDTAADLKLARDLGVGKETAKVLESLDPSTFAE